MMWSAYGMPIVLNAATYGEAPSSLSFHGRMHDQQEDRARRRRSPIRRITDWVALAIALSGSCDSAAATVAISAPTIEKMTTTMLEKIAPTPLGKKPPWAVRLLKSRLLARATGRGRTACRAPGRRMIATTLIPANQYSNSPYDADREQVRRGHQHHQAQRQQPQRRVEPEGEDLGAGHGLEADHDHPEVPVQPGDREARPAAERLAGVVGERAGRGVRGRHLAEHPHDQDDQHAGDGVGQEGAGPGLVDHHAGPDEQAGADDAADGDHREVSLLQALLELGGFGGLCHGTSLPFGVTHCAAGRLPSTPVRRSIHPPASESRSVQVTLLSRGHRAGGPCRGQPRGLAADGVQRLSGRGEQPGRRRDSRSNSRSSPWARARCARASRTAAVPGAALPARGRGFRDGEVPLGRRRGRRRRRRRWRPVRRA